MTEIIARIAPNSQIELFRDDGKPIDSGVMQPLDAIYLARAIFASAASLSGENHPPVGMLVNDVHIPILQWETGTSESNGDPTMILTLPPGIELTFLLTRQGAKELGMSLVVRGEGKQPLERPRAKAH